LIAWTVPAGTKKKSPFFAGTSFKTSFHFLFLIFSTASSFELALSP